MTEPFLNREEVSSLQKVLLEANRVYAKEFRTSNKSDFSLWRVLAAFRMLHRDSPESLYNSIIYIAKIQNPQSYKQWTRAVDELGKLKKNTERQSNNYYRPNSSMHTRTYQNSFNRSRVNSKEHLQSKSFAQIKIPEGIETSKANFVEDYSQKDVSQTNAETNTRQYLTKPESGDYHPKVHYISFEPYSKCEDTTQHDKENINSTNVGESYRRESAYQYIEAIQRDLTRTSKQSQSRSPIDQSFIKNMSASESPYLIAKLKSQMSDPYDDQMQLRATTVHKFNLQLKAFNSLLANFLVSKKGKDDEIKAAKQGTIISLQKGLSGLKENIAFCRKTREQQKKADIYFQANIYKKTFNLLKFIYDLRRRHCQVKIEKYNKNNFEFILALLLKIQSVEEGHCEWIDFQGKIDQMIHEDQADKLCLIAKYFGQHSWIKEKNVQQLLSNYKRAIYKQVFKAFTINKTQNYKLVLKRQTFLLNNCFVTLKTRWGRIRSLKKKMMEAQAIRNRVLLQKVMKVLQETVYSTKLYSKRCEYLHKKYSLKLKMVAYIRWIELTRKQLKQSENVKRKARSCCESLISFFMKYSFRRIYEEMQETNYKTNNLVETIQLNQKLHFFTYFKNMIQDTQCKWEILEWYNLKLCKRSLICWKKETKVSKGLNNIFRVMTQFHIRQYAIPKLREAAELYREIRFSQAQIMKRSMETFKKWVINKQQQREGLSSKLRQKLQLFRKNEGITAFRLFYMRQKDIKCKNRLTQNIYQFKMTLMRRKKQLFLNHLGQNLLSKVQRNNESQKLIESLQQWQIKNVIFRLRMLNSQNMNYMRLKQNIYKAKSLQVVEQMNLAIIDMKIRKIELIRKSVVLVNIAKISFNSYRRQGKNMQTAKRYCDLQIAKKVFANFRQLIQMSHQVKDLVQRNVKYKTYASAKNFLMKWQQDHCLQKIGSKIAKKQLFSKIRQNYVHRYNSQLLISIRTDTELRRSIINLRQFWLKQCKSKQIDDKSKWLSKRYVLHKLKMNFNISLVHTKYLYMVFKFRALKLCSQVFINWKGLLFNKPKQVRHKRNRNERLSTDYIIQ